MNGRIVKIIIGVVVLVGAAVFAWLFSTPGATSFAKGKTVALADYQGANPTGVPASLRDASLVERGQYLTRAADCEACHTAPGGQPFAGGLSFTLPFGTIYSTNITPDAKSGIGQYTDAQFIAVMRHGIRPDGQRLYPAMPYTSYGLLTDDDMLAIKAYLLSLDPVEAQTPETSLSFPYNQRWLMGIWSWMFNPGEAFRPNPEQSPEWNRGAYLAEAAAHCGECHTPRNLAFALNNRDKFAGATNAGWRAFNISSSEDRGVGGWTDEALASYLSTGFADGHGVATGPMGEAIDLGLRHLAPEDIAALVTYLRSTPARTGSDPERVRQPADPSYKVRRVEDVDRLGEKVFAGACAGCHDWTGVSELTSQATLTGLGSVNDPSAGNVARVVLFGAERHADNGLLLMPEFGSSYSNQEIAAVSNYVTARFGAKGAKLTEADIAKIRAAGKH